MELFKSECLQKEYKEFTEKLLPAVLECGYCNILACHWHGKFVVVCANCRKIRCINCYKFDISKDILLDKADRKTHDYLLNFICDFLKLSSTSIQHYFPNVEVKKKEKVHSALSYVKSNKNRAQVVSVKIPTGKKTATFQNGRCKRKVFY